MMDAREFVPLALLAMGGEIQGKTKVQKTVYFLGLLTGCLEDLGFRAHFYGPYSDDVADALGWLRTIGAVDSTSAGVGTVDHAGFEIRRHDFRLNEEGRQFSEATARKYPELWEELRRFGELMKKSGDLDYVKMSIAAKTYFMLQKTRGKATEEELAQLATRFGWDVTPEQVKEAGRYLERLKLVEIADD